MISFFYNQIYIFSVKEVFDYLRNHYVKYVTCEKTLFAQVRRSPGTQPRFGPIWFPEEKESLKSKWFESRGGSRGLRCPRPLNKWEMLSGVGLRWRNAVNVCPRLITFRPIFMPAKWVRLHWPRTSASPSTARDRFLAATECNSIPPVCFTIAVVASRPAIFVCNGLYGKHRDHGNGTN